MSDDEKNDSEDQAPKGGLGILFIAAGFGLALLLTIIALLAYAAMK